ncbi:hypothetical protein [Streptomyces sp. NPDC047042]|uniref:hypothetical protein n=1 Tax=Streptomyces sp. NPDC047042 TaxID=3154807 RepID=UPI0034025FB6
MDHTPVTDWITQAASAAEKQGSGGSGDLLRVVLIVMFFGCILTAWFVLRGYKQKDD